MVGGRECDMIQRTDVLSIPFLHKSVFTGSYQGMRYRLEKKKREACENQEEQSAAEEKPVDCLLVTFWPGPYSFAATSEEKKSREFIFGEEGIEMAVSWLNQEWEQQKETFGRAWENW